MVKVQSRNLNKNKDLHEKNIFYNTCFQVFTSKNATIANINTAGERNLLKAMLKDVINKIKDSVQGVVVISSDKDVLNFVSQFDVVCLTEKGKTDLNGALMQAVNWCSEQAHQVLIIPSDIPLIRKSQTQEIIGLAEKWPVIIAPAKEEAPMLFNTNAWGSNEIW